MPVLVPAAAALALYAVTLSFDRTFDDHYHTQDRGKDALGSFAGIWKSPYWGAEVGSGLFRPVVSTTFRAETMLGLPLAARHALNVFLHAAVCGLLAGAALRLGLGLRSATSFGLLFAVHPTHVESVAGLVGRAELLAALFMLMALMLHDRVLVRPPRGPGGGGDLKGISTLAMLATLAFLAAGSKESAWLLPLYALPLHLVRSRALRDGAPAWGGYLIGIGAHLVLRHEALGAWLNAPGAVVDPSDNPLVSLDGAARWMAGLRVLGLNLGHLVFPWAMSPDYSGGHVNPAGGWGDPRLWGGILLLAGSALAVLLGVSGRRSPRGRALLLGGTWLFAAAVFMMNLFLDLGTILGDRLLFWPSGAWCLLLVGVLASPAPVSPAGASGKRFKDLPANRRAAWVVVGLLAGFYLVSTVRHLPAWRNDTALFRSALRVSPKSPRVWFNWGRAIHTEGQMEEALAAYRKARSLSPDDYQAWAQEAVVLLAMGKLEEAREPMDRALRLNPRDTVSLTNQGILWMETGEAARAVDRFQELLQEDPDRLDVRLNLALALGRLGRSEEAETEYRKYLAHSPEDPEALNNLAWLLATQLDRPREAEALASRAVRIDPGNPNLLDTLAETLIRQGRLREAEEMARSALRLNPSPDLQASLGRFFGTHTSADSAAASRTP